MSTVKAIEAELKKAIEEHTASLNPRGKEKALRERVSHLKRKLAEARNAEAKPMKEGEMSERKRRGLAKEGDNGRS